MKVTGTKRGQKGGRRLDLTDMRAALKDDRLWTVHGVVYVPDDQPSHYRLVEKDGRIVDVLVEVETSLSQLDLSCRLGTLAGGPGGGLWRVPPVGADVIVAIPEGSLNFLPTIVAWLSSGEAPGRVGEDKTILVAADTVEITAPRIVLGPDPGAVVDERDGFVHGRARDTFTGAEFWQLQSTSTKVMGNR